MSASPPQAASASLNGHQNTAGAQADAERKAFKPFSSDEEAVKPQTKIKANVDGSDSLSDASPSSAVHPSTGGKSLMAQNGNKPVKTEEMPVDAEDAGEGEEDDGEDDDGRHGNGSGRAPERSDFDADPALWGLRRSSRAPKKVYVDSSAGEESDDEEAGGPSRGKTGRRRGK